jgi:hypothetical protein
MIEFTPIASKLLANGFTENRENRSVFDIKFNFQNLRKENKKPVFQFIDWFSASLS